jgi:UDP-glucose 4-epimerase
MNHIKNSSILVTGGLGFIGRHLVERLIHLNYEVTVFDMYYPEKMTNENSGGIMFIQGDISNDSDIKKLKPYAYDIIFHLASGASVPNSVIDPESDFFSTAYGTLKILELAREKKVNKFIYISTVSIYDTNNIMPMGENARVKVSSPFGASKLAGESYCYAYNRTYGLETNIIRLFNAYGPGMSKYFIHDIICKFIKNTDNVEVLGNGKQIRDYLYVDDVIDAFIIVMEKGLAGEDYNLGSGIPVCIIDVVKKIADLMKIENYKVNLTNQSWSGDIKEWYADINKIKKLGFNVKTEFDEGLKNTIDYLLKNK